MQTKKRHKAQRGPLEREYQDRGKVKPDPKPEKKQKPTLGK